jgi:hypothetical protein
LAGIDPFGGIESGHILQPYTFGGDTAPKNEINDLMDVLDDVIDRTPAATSEVIDSMTSAANQCS